MDLLITGRFHQKSLDLFRGFRCGYRVRIALTTWIFVHKTGPIYSDGIGWYWMVLDGIPLDPKTMKNEGFNPQYMGHNPLKRRFWVLMVDGIGWYWMVLNVDSKLKLLRSVKRKNRTTMILDRFSRLIQQNLSP